MGHKPKHKMLIAERAKQFAPFAAIKGLEAALKKKEQELIKQQKSPVPEDDKAK